MAGESARESARRLREKGERLQRMAEMYERGQVGEEATAAVLAQLPPGDWAVLHDLHWPGRTFANVDHVVIGPSGVFVIDSKNWSGEVRVRDDVLRQNGRKRETAVAGAAEAALAVSSLTQFVTPQQVHPVLCFVRDEPVTGWARDVMVSSTTTLLDMLLSRPPVLSPEQCRLVTLDLDAGLRPATGPRPAPRTHGVPGVGPRSTYRPLAQRPAPKPRPKRRRKKRGHAKDLVVVAALMTFVFVPGVRDGVIDAVTSFIASEVNPPAPETVEPPNE